MLVIQFIQKAYEMSLEAYKLLTAKENEDVQRQKLSMSAIECLKNETDGHIKIEVIKASYMGEYSSDLQVSIIFQVQARPEKYVEQHVFYAVDTSSWKSLTNDLNVLGMKFLEANKRAYPQDRCSEDSLMKKYRDLVKTIEQESVLQPKSK